MKRVLSAAIAGLTALGAATHASAGPLTVDVEFDFRGGVQAGFSNITLDDGSFPEDDIIRTDNELVEIASASVPVSGSAFGSGFVSDRSSTADAFATLHGTGSDDPFVFANGSTAAGDSTSFAETRIIATITNTSSIDQDVTWEFLIFPGGVGVAQPDFFEIDEGGNQIESGSCSPFELDICDSFSAPFVSDHGASAGIEFSVTLNPDEADERLLFGGNIFVSEFVQEAMFEGIELEDFGQNPNNPQFFSFGETVVTELLGTLAPGESLILEFFARTEATTSPNSPCLFGDIESSCVTASAGFGDPPRGTGGGIIHRHFSLEGDAPFGSTVTVAEVPVPGAAWLFGSALVAGYTAKRKKKNS